MSLEDDTENSDVELRELVTQTLEENGVLSQIKAQLRAGLYLALENDINSGCQKTYNEFLKTKLKNPDIRIIFCLVREFLDYFELNYTCSVFDKESLIGSSYNYENRDKLIQELDIGIDALHNAPLLLEILNIARSSFNISIRDIKFNSTTNMDNKNETYDVISQESTSSAIEDEQNNRTTKKLNGITESDKTENAVTESDKTQNGDAESNKTQSSDAENVKKQNSDSQLSQSENVKNGGCQSDSSEIKSESVPEEIITEELEVKISEKNGNYEEKFETDDTYEGTSSIAEDSISNKEQSALIDFDKSIKIPNLTNDEPLFKISKIPFNLELPTTDSGKLSESSLKTPISSEKRSKAEKFEKQVEDLLKSPISSEKRKNEKSEKLKPMSALTSLSDLPPLPLNKSRNSDTFLLPSLYSKEFREKTPTKDIDKFLDMNFDSLDNYEEDFLTNSIVKNENNLITAQTNLTKNDNNDRPITDNLPENGNKINKESAQSSNSEEFDINSNLDDILKSETTT